MVTFGSSWPCWSAKSARCLHLLSWVNLFNIKTLFMKKTMIFFSSLLLLEKQSLFPCFLQQGKLPVSQPSQHKPVWKFSIIKVPFLDKWKEAAITASEVCWAWCGLCLVWLSVFLFLLISANVTGNKQGCSLRRPSVWAKCLGTGTAAWRSSLVSSFGLLLCVDTSGSTAKWDLMEEWSDCEKLIYVLAFLLGYL